MSIFQMTKDAKEFQGAPYPVPGFYEVVINRCKEATDRKKIGMFIVELKITKSDVSDRPVESSMDWVVKFDKDAAGGNVKTFIKQALNSWCVDNGRAPMAGDDFELDEKLWEAVVGTQNFLAGTSVAITAYNKPTAEGKDFTRLKWEFTAAQKSKLGVTKAA
jgi:hypothetical protein